MSERKAALVTGSASGIGLGIATAFAKAGMNVTLNGLGDAAEIERTRAALEREAGVTVIPGTAEIGRSGALSSPSRQRFNNDVRVHRRRLGRFTTRRASSKKTGRS